jgi:hypothetical protein
MNVFSVLSRPIKNSSVSFSLLNPIFISSCFDMKILAPSGGMVYYSD